MWGLSSLSRPRTFVCCTGRWILNHWTVREVPCFSYLPTYSGFPGVSAVKNLHTVQEMQETWVRSPTTTIISKRTFFLLLSATASSYNTSECQQMFRNIEQVNTYSDATLYLSVSLKNGVLIKTPAWFVLYKGMNPALRAL